MEIKSAAYVVVYVSIFIFAMTQRSGKITIFRAALNQYLKNPGRL